MAPRSASCSCASNVHLHIHRLGSLATRSIHASLSCYQGVLSPGLPGREDSLAPRAAATGRMLPKKPNRWAPDQSKHQNRRRHFRPRKYRMKGNSWADSHPLLLSKTHLANTPLIQTALQRRLWWRWCWLVSWYDPIDVWCRYFFVSWLFTQKWMISPLLVDRQLTAVFLFQQYVYIYKNNQQFTIQHWELKKNLLKILWFHH